MATAVELQALLEQLLVPDSDVIDKATKRLKDLYTDKDLIASLCTVLATSNAPQVRQYAAVLLRKKINKKSQWSRLHPEIQKGLKENVLPLLARESENVVRNSVAQLIGTVARHDIEAWPQLFQFLDQYTRSVSAIERQVSMLVLKTVSAEASEQLQPHLGAILLICAQTIQDRENALVPLYTVQVLNNIVFDVTSSERAQYSALIPQVLIVIKNLARQDEDQACEAMEIFDSLVECEVGMLSPHVKSIVDFCLELSADEQNHGDLVRVKALAIISWLVTLKKKAILKLNLVQPIMDIVFSVMCRCDEDENDIVDNEETQKAATYAARIMDSLALHLPPEKIVNHVMKRSDEALRSTRASDRKAGYVALGVIAEGCSEHITSNYLPTFLECALNGLKDAHPAVRNGAMFAVGQFSEYLQPGITKYASEVLPRLLEYVTAARKSDNPSISTLTRAYYALEAFVENLEKDVVPYLPALMDHLLSLLADAGSGNLELALKLKEFSFSCIGAIAVAGKKEIAIYLASIMEHLKVYLSQVGGEEVQQVQLQALDTLSTLAREVGAETFAPLVGECIALGLHLLENFTDPDVRRCVYGLFGSLATLKTPDMAANVEKIAGLLLTSMRSAEGMKAHLNEEDEKMFEAFLEEDSADQNGEEVDEEVKGFSIENAYLDEKEAAVCTIGELAENYSEAFLPHLEESYREVLAAMDYDVADMLQSCVRTLGSFACALHAMASKSSADGAAVSQQLWAALSTMLAELLPKLLVMAKEEKDRMVVMSVLNVLQELLEEIGLPVLHSGVQTLADIAACVRDVLKSRTACQDQDEEESSIVEDSAQEAEYDTLLVENAGAILPVLAKVVGSVQFTPYLTEFLPDLLKRTKSACTVAEKSFSIGTLGEILQEMGVGSAAPFANQLYPVFQRGIKDADDEVRNNSVYSMGVLAAHSGTSLQHKYAEITSALLSLLDKEKHAYVVDNICGALARLLASSCGAANPTALMPLRDVYPKLLEHLPLKEDFSENETVFDCICGPMYQFAKAQVVDNLPRLLHVLTLVLATDNVKPGNQEKLAAMIVSMQSDEPVMLRQAMASVPLTSLLWKLFP